MKSAMADAGLFGAQKENTDQVQRMTRRGADTGGGELSPGADEVRSQLRCILESREFRKSKRSQQFLKHVVDCALTGDVRNLKESVIGLEVFGRAPGYDTGGDSTVRVRASDVRRRLLAYYQRVGNTARVRIELPSGSYVPGFSRLQSISPPLAPGRETQQTLDPLAFSPLDGTSLHSPQQEGPEATGSEFLYSLIDRLARAMDGDCAYIGTVTTEDVSRVKTIAVVAGGHITANFEYALADSPCENVIGRTVQICPKEVQQEFPKDFLLREMNVESYAGAPLFDCRGGSLGLLVVLSQRPLRDTQLAKSVLEVYAARIAAELERTIAEHRLQESERRYQALFESAGDAILLLRGGRFVDFNPKALQLFGCTREQLLGQTPFAFAPRCQPDGRDSREVGMAQLGQARRGQAVSYDWRALRLDDSVFDAQVTLTRVDNAGTPHFLAHVRDVTHSREAERRVRESEARFRAVFEGAGIGMAVLDLHGRIIESNAAFQAALGYSETELAGIAFPELTHPDDVGSEVRLFTELLQGKLDSYQIEKRYLRKDGQVVWCMLVTSLVRSPDGEPQYCIRMAENITARKRAEEALRKSEERFRSLFECFLGSHYLLDLNTSRPSVTAEMEIQDFSLEIVGD